MTAICRAGTKSNRLVFYKAGDTSCSHRHHQDHWTHFRKGGPFYVRVFHVDPMTNRKAQMKSAHGPFGPGEKFFVDKELIHEVIAEGPGEADCVFVDDGSPNVAKER